MDDTSASSNGGRAGMKEGTSEDLNRKLQGVKLFRIQLPRLVKEQA